MVEVNVKYLLPLNLVHKSHHLILVLAPLVLKLVDNKSGIIKAGAELELRLGSVELNSSDSNFVFVLKYSLNIYKLLISNLII